MRRAILAVALALAALLAVPAARASAAEDPGARALDWAEAHALNDPYLWGGSGPYAYDCSGLVMAAFARADGIWLPHNTVAMVDSGRLVRTWAPQRGDLAMFGPVGAPFHVEFVTDWYMTGFGAETYGWAGRVTWHSWDWLAPSAYYRVVLPVRQRSAGNPPLVPARPVG